MRYIPQLGLIVLGSKKITSKDYFLYAQVCNMAEFLNAITTNAVLCVPIS